MSYVPESKASSYFCIDKNHTLSELMLDLLIHVYDNKPMFDPWAHYEHTSLVKLGKKLEGALVTFENTRPFRSWVNAIAKQVKPFSF